MMSSSQPRRRAGDDYSTPHPSSRIPQTLTPTPPVIPGASAHHTISPFEPRGPSPGPPRTRLGAMTTSPRVAAHHGPPHRYEAQAGSAYPSARFSPEDPRSRELGRAYERPAPLEPADREDPRRLPYRYPEYERDYPSQEAMYLAPPKSHSSGGLAVAGSSSAAVAGPPYEPVPHPYSASQVPGPSSRRLSAGDTASLFAHHPPPLSRSPLPPAAMRERPEREDILTRSSPSRSQSTQPRTCFTPSPRYSVEGLSRGHAELYNQGWHDAMEAVQQGVVWIEGVAHSRVPMWIPESERQSYPQGPRRDERERMEREYLEAEWRERAGSAREQPWQWDQREAYGPGPSRSQSAPDPRTAPSYQDYPTGMGGALPHYGPSAPPMPPQPSAHYPVPYGTPVARGPMRRPIPGYTMPPEHFGHMPPGYPPYGAHAGMRTHLQPPQIRTRQQISCHPCRNRKVKCSGTKPCDACVKIKRESECQYEKTVRRRGKGKKGITQDPSERGDSREGDSRDDNKKDYAKSGTSEQNSDDETGDHPHRSSVSRSRSRSHSRSRSRSRSASPPRKSKSESSSRADRDRHRVRKTDQESHQRHDDRRASDVGTPRDRSP